MEFEVSYDFENEQQFWDELHDTVTRDCDTHTLIDDALRSYLTLVARYQGDFIRSDYDFARCSFQLHSSPLFDQHAEYVRKQLLHALLEEADTAVLQVAASFLLADARENEATYELLNKENAFPRLVDLVSGQQHDEHTGLHRLLMELLYEMSRVQKISAEDLMHVSDDFVINLFKIIEELSNDVGDPYHYPIIRILLVLNEQFLLSAHGPTGTATSTVTVTNKVMKVLTAQGSKFKTFGENIILLLNREDETSLQLLTLKLLYLVFTTPPTHEYFYTNDLRVLVDILIRNLLDLPEESSALRHTYLRVLFPLLSHTQLRNPPHYKQEELRKLLSILVRGQGAQTEAESSLESDWGHFGELDETTKRLVRRCQTVEWLRDPDDEDIVEVESPVDTKSSPTSPDSPSKSKPPALPAPRKLTKRNSSKGSELTIGAFLTPQLETARHSSISIAQMAAQREKPGVITPSRNPSLKHNLRTVILLGKKERPPLPKARRSVAARGGERQVEGELSNKLDLGATPLPIEGATATPDHVQERPTSSSSQKSPPVPPRLSDFRKPPPSIPRTRRWRFLSRDEGGTHGHKSSGREPGKFDAYMPSVRPLIATAPSKTSPPPRRSLGRDTSPNALSKQPEPPTETVSEALNSAQDQANTTIAEALDTIDLQSPFAGPERIPEALEPDEEVSPTRVTGPRIVTTFIGTPATTPTPTASPSPTTVRPPSPTPPPPPPHHTRPVSTTHTRSQSTPNPTFQPPYQPSSPTSLYKPLPPPPEEPRDAPPVPTKDNEINSQQHPDNLPPAPAPPSLSPTHTRTRTLLAPPDTAPIRPVPGPRWELERSPFLSEEDPEEERVEGSG